MGVLEVLEALPPCSQLIGRVQRQPPSPWAVQRFQDFKPL
ncbi:hypothetical protein TCCBUS3UF1_2460 [Thermus sp. CCB_US3_UF1]|nr:hypothetical protein TCCBUS3UF1_2460 [Thermus sp. CCB_US3_UF1]